MVKKEIKKEIKADKCTCGCNCDESCDCGCQDGCDCCCCEKKKFVAKSAVMFGSALLIAGAILVAAPNNCPCPKGGHMNGPRMGRMAPKAAPMNEQAMRDFLMKNPKVLIDSVDAYYRAQEAQRAAAPQPDETVPADIIAGIVADKTNHVLGNPRGKFVIVEFFDYQCGWCKKTNTEMAEAVKKGKNIRWILMDAPIFGEASELIARYAYAAKNQGKFKEMHEAIGQAQGKVDEDALIAMGKKLKLNVDQLKKDAHSDAAKNKIAQNKELAAKMGVSGVPMLIVNGKIHRGALLGEALDKVVAESNK